MDPPMATESKLAVILHADIVGSTALVHKNEQIAHERIRAVLNRLSQSVSEHAGIAHEVRGDALVAEFARPSDAVTAALAFQELNAACNEALTDETRPDVRIGIAMGEVVVADDTVTGAGVVLAQRLEQVATPCGVTISAAIRESVSGRLMVTYDDLGEMVLKGFDIPQRVYRVRNAIGGVVPRALEKEPVAVELESTRPEQVSIAVLAFENLSSDPEQGYFADGMAEDIITALSKFRWLFVIARNSSFTYKGRAVDVKQVGRELGARYVLEGSVRRAGQRIRVTGQLIEARTGNHIWAEHYDREFHDLFVIQDELTEALVAAIAPEIDQAERQRAQRSPPTTVDTWLLYQRGLSAYYLTTKDALEEAVEIFDSATAIDPNFAPALAMSAVSRARLAINFLPTEHDALMQAAQRQSEEAVRLDGRDPVVLWANGRVQSLVGNIEDAISQTERAISLNPNYAMAYFGLGNVLSRANRPAEALESVARAIRLSPCDPFLPAFYVVQAVALHRLGRNEECVKVARRAISTGRATIWANAFLAAALHQMDSPEAARDAVILLLDREPSFSITFCKRALRSSPAEFRERFFAALRAVGVPEE
jgi:adenylate cyclase